MTTTFDRHLLFRFLHVFCILFISTFGLYVVIDGFTNVDGFQQGRDSAVSVLLAMSSYYMFQSSLFFNMVGSILGVTAAIVVFALLQRNSELHPLLAAGVPTIRLVVPVVMGMLIVTAVVIANQELIIPSIARHLMAPRGDEPDDEISGGQQVEPVYDYKTGLHIAGAELFLGSRKMKQAKFLLPVREIAQELTTLRAREAVFFKKKPNRPAGWLLRDVSPPFEQIPLTPAGRKIVRPLKNSNDVFVVTDVSFDQLFDRSRSYKFVSTPELIRRIKNPSYGIVSVRGQTLHLHTRLVQPFFNLVAVLLAVPLILRKEGAGLVADMAICSLLLAAVLGVAHAFLYLAQVNLIAPDLAAWAPVIFSGSLCAWFSGIMQT